MGNRIKELRKSRGWSQTQLSELSGVRILTIQQMESKSSYSGESIQAIANAFGLDVTEFSSLTKMRKKTFVLFDFKNNRVIEKMNNSKQFIIAVNALLIFPTLFFIFYNLLKYNLGVDSLPEVETLLGRVGILYFALNNILPFFFLISLISACAFNGILLVTSKSIIIKNEEVDFYIRMRKNLTSFFFLLVALICLISILLYFSLENLI